MKVKFKKVNWLQRWPISSGLGLSIELILNSGPSDSTANSVHNFSICLAIFSDGQITWSCIPLKPLYLLWSLYYRWRPAGDAAMTRDVHGNEKWDKCPRIHIGGVSCCPASGKGPLPGAPAGIPVVHCRQCSHSHYHLCWLPAQTPMYFFLSIFSFCECCFRNTVIPKLLLIFLLGSQNISFAACFIQAFFFIFLGAAGFVFIAVVSLDRYMAICKPLHYLAIMNLRICFFLITACFASGFTLITGLMVKVSQLSFCGPHVIPHFFCDLSLLAHLSFSDTKSVEMLAFVLTLCILLTFLIIIIFTKSNIIFTIVSRSDKKLSPPVHLTSLFSLWCMAAVSLHVWNESKQTGWIPKGRLPLWTQSWFHCWTLSSILCRISRYSRPLEEWCVEWKYQNKKSHGHGVDGFRESYIFIPVKNY